MNPQKLRHENQSHDARAIGSVRGYLGIPYFIHPVPLSAVILLAFNDHYLKRHHPFFLTGKLSDFAGIFFFPLFLCALFQLTSQFLILLNRCGRIRNASVRCNIGASDEVKLLQITRNQIAGAILATDLIFIGVKFIAAISQLYLAFSKAMGYPSRVTPDVTDRMALSMNWVTWKYAARQIRLIELENKPTQIDVK